MANFSQLKISKEKKVGEKKLNEACNEEKFYCTNEALYREIATHNYNEFEDNDLENTDAYVYLRDDSERV